MTPTGIRFGIALALVGTVIGSSPSWGQEAKPAVREAWDAVFIAGKKVGYIQTKVEPVAAKDGRSLLRVQVQTQLKFKRQSDTVSIQTRYGTIETPEGSVLRLDSRTLTGPMEMRLSGDVVDGTMGLSLVAGGKTERLDLPWGEDVRGPYGPEQSLSRQPMKPGERREVKTFIPDLNRIGLTVLEAKENGSVTLGGGAVMELLRVEGAVKGPDGKLLPGMQTTYWVDAGGQMLKSETDFLGGLVTYRTTREAALSAIETPLNLVEATVVPVSRRISQPEATRSAVLNLVMKGERADVVFPNDDRQQVTMGTDGRAVLRVKTVGPGEGTAVKEVADEYIRPNPMVNSEDARVVALAKRATGNLTDPWAKAAAIQKWVGENIKEKNFEVSFATASDVAKSLEGDCSEHAVLTAAMCRAVGVPARVVVGLIYADEFPGFGYHMWDEVLINGQWVAVDPTFGQSEVDAVHLKLTDSSLAGISPYETFLSVARVFNKLEIEPVEVR